MSISSIAVELAQQIFGSLDGRRVLLLGAGKMSESAARNLGKRGARLFVVNRSPEKAKALAVSCGRSPRPLENLEEELRDADVVISSTSSPDYVIGADLMKRVVKARKRRPLFLIDIAVPRDIEPAIADLDNVFLYDVDDLSQVAADNLAARRREADAAERIVAEEVAAFESWRASLDLKPTIVSLREHFQSVAREELARLGDKTSLPPGEQEKLEAMAHRLVNRLLHQPLTELKKGQSPGETMRLVAAVHQLFPLERPKGDKE
ncbi:MAG: glutamyl-tRNA reductase [Myxococcales bacterium]|nr:glutamyl-tRNA reductase [Myxococcales bacterium]